MEANELKLFKISNGALQGAALPARLKILNWGANETIDGPVTAGPRTADRLAANQRQAGYERVAIDFDHCTVAGTGAHRDLTAAGQPPLIFGYGRVQPVPGDGIWLEDVTWTPLGLQHARNFEDLSPALREADGEVVLIHSVALTPNGKVNGLQFFSATQTNHTTMTNELAELLGLPATTSQENLLAELKKRLAAPALLPLSARLDALELKLHTHTAATLDAERDRLVRLFAAEGKVPKRATGETYSAAELKTLDPETLRLLHANTPVTVPLAARASLSQTDSHPVKNFKDDKGRIDLAALFEAEGTQAAA